MPDAPGLLTRRRPGTTLLLALALGGIALAAFGRGLYDLPYWVDESAFISQSYYWDVMARGDRDDPAWLGYPAVDLPPLSKYLIGLALAVTGQRRPAPAQAAAWYYEINRGFEPGAAVEARWPPAARNGLGSWHVGSLPMLMAARWPSAALGAAGVVAVFALGTLARGRLAGVLAAGLMLANPLYGVLARRAMPDVPCEALTLVALAVFLWAWRGVLAGGIGPAGWVGASAFAGLMAGLAVLAKLNGVLAMLTLAAWAGLALALPGVPVRRKVAVAASAMVAGLVAVAVVFALNPTLTARPRGPIAPELEPMARRGPLGRAGAVIEHRLAMSAAQRDAFAAYGLRSPGLKLKAVAVQGLGRFGPFGPRLSHTPTVFDWVQDRGALLWGPWVAAGAAWALARGRRQLRDGEPPAAWAVLIHAATALAVVTAYIPLAWDRYYLPIQSGHALLAAGVAATGLRRVAERLRRTGAPAASG